MKQYLFLVEPLLVTATGNPFHPCLRHRLHGLQLHCGLCFIALLCHRHGCAVAVA